MLHIRPVSEQDASEKVQQVYKDIKETLNIHFVPLVFQYIAGFEEYFLYAWDKYKTNLVSEYYKNAVLEMVKQSRDSIETIYKPSREFHAFVKTISSAEKEHIRKTVGQLELLNAYLLILTIGLREGVKGVQISQQVLPKDIDYSETIFDAFINQKIMHENLRAQEKDVIPGARMLAPLFGNSSIIISRYPEFFTHVAKEMEHLMKKEIYLKERVDMEVEALKRIFHLPYPLGCTYAEIARFAGKKPYFSELLYVLSETFPTSFPRLLLTSSLMYQVLQG